ncbi:DUF2937 family protein [Rhizobium herbae]|uniref:DUF2937 family protein n=1 Tax=Rhizobium herbae TaxID=508661 RepID=A0ABS4EN86_9HYPH|nr:DUF2937 family protein [Rhizobium herbae]MBP1859419.1 hypothetical protein [Rhizobium herbae]
MRPIARFIALGAALFGGIVASQAPELTQQYRQRIGGALDELRVLVEAFDQQAGSNALDREKALGIYAASAEPFLKEQGETMRDTIIRYETLKAQEENLASAAPILQPFVLVRDADGAVLGNAWRDFIPAVPISLPGLTWAGIGFAAGWVLTGLAAFLSRGAYRLGAGRRYRLLH